MVSTFHLSSDGSKRPAVNGRVPGSSPGGGAMTILKIIGLLALSAITASILFGERCPLCKNRMEQYSTHKRVCSNKYCGFFYKTGL